MPSHQGVFNLHTGCAVESYITVATHVYKVILNERKIK